MSDYRYKYNLKNRYNPKRADYHNPPQSADYGEYLQKQIIRNEQLLKEEKEKENPNCERVHAIESLISMYKDKL